MPGSAEQFSILLADDDPQTHLLLREILNEEKYNLYSVKNGKEVLKLIGHFGYDLLILDVSLPDIDGYLLAKKISRNISNKPPILLFTVNDMPLEQESFRKSGADAIMQKGVSVDEIKKVVDKLLKPKEQIPETPPAPAACEYAYSATEDIRKDITQILGEIRSLNLNLEKIKQQHQWLVRDFLGEKQKIERQSSSKAKFQKEIKTMRIWIYAIAAAAMLALIKSFF